MLNRITQWWRDHGNGAISLAQAVILAAIYGFVGWYLFFLTNPQGLADLNWYPTGWQAQLMSGLLYIYFYSEGCFSLCVGGVLLPIVAPIFGLVCLPFDLTLLYLGTVVPVLCLLSWKASLKEKIAIGVVTTLVFRGLYVLVALVVSPCHFLVGWKSLDCSNPMVEWGIRAYLLISYGVLVLKLIQERSSR